MTRFLYESYEITLNKTFLLDSKYNFINSRITNTDNTKKSHTDMALSYDKYIIY